MIFCVIYSSLLTSTLIAVITAMEVATPDTTEVVGTTVVDTMVAITTVATATIPTTVAEAPVSSFEDVTINRALLMWPFDAVEMR